MIAIPYHACGYQMIRTIEIRNFRCFEHLQLEGCRRFNVIVGDNGTGKTALLEAMFLALGATPQLGLRYRQQRGLDGLFNGTPRQIEEALWKDLFYAGNWDRPIQIELTGDGQENRSVTVYRGRSQFTIPLLAGSQEEERHTAPIRFEWRDADGKKHPYDPKVGPQGLQGDQSDEDLPDFFFLPRESAYRFKRECGTLFRASAGGARRIFHQANN